MTHHVPHPAVSPHKYRGFPKPHLQGAAMIVVVVNTSSVADEDLQAIVDASNFEAQDFSRLCNVAVPTFAMADKSKPLPAGAKLAHVCPDVPGAPAGALAWHDELGNGVQEIQCPVNIVLGQGGGVLDGGSIGWSVAEALTHEFWELCKDPSTTLWADYQPGKKVALEVGDPVEATPIPWPVQHRSKGLIHVPVSNYVTERWFDPLAPTNGTVSFDRGGLLKTPLTKLTTGYLIFDDGTEGTATGLVRRIRREYGSEFPEVRRAAKEAKFARRLRHVEAHAKAHSARVVVEQKAA